MQKPPRLYAIADGDFLGLGAMSQAVSALAEAGFSWIQLRLKNAADHERWCIAEECLRLLEGGPASLWIDDRVDLALLLPCFGVQLGQEDLPPARARALLGKAKAIGASTHNESECRQAEADEAVDLVAAGPIFSTASKRGAGEPLGLAGLRRLKGVTRKPLVAIGGIDEARLVSVLEAGADAVALLSALGPAAGIAARARRLLRLAA